MASKGTPATALLTQRGVPFQAHTYQVDPRATSYGEAAAAALDVDPARLFKTLVVDADGRLAVGVVPVSASLNLKAIAAALGAKKAVLADPAAAERATGYVTGGISPLGQRSRLPMVIDASAGNWPTVFVSGGRRGLQLEIAPDRLIEVTGAAVAAVAGQR